MKKKNQWKKILGEMGLRGVSIGGGGGRVVGLFGGISIEWHRRATRRGLDAGATATVLRRVMKRGNFSSRGER